MSSTGGPRADQPRRRVFTAEYKLAMVAEYDRAAPRGRSALLRRERLYHSHIIEWRKARDAGTLVARRGAEPAGAEQEPSGSPRRRRRSAATAEQAELERLRRQNEKLAKDLARSQAALEIMGKHTRSWSCSPRARTPSTDRGREGDGRRVRRAHRGRRGRTPRLQARGSAPSTHYWRARPKPAVSAPRVPRPAPANALTVPERERVLALLRDTSFVDKSPAQVWAHLLDDGIYLCSQSTMYRILREHGESRERRRQATHPPRVKPELVAHAPGQTYSWDITKLRGRGICETHVIPALGARKLRELTATDVDRWLADKAKTLSTASWTAPCQGYRRCRNRRNDPDRGGSHSVGHSHTNRGHIHR